MPVSLLMRTTRSHLVKLPIRRHYWFHCARSREDSKTKTEMNEDRQTLLRLIISGTRYEQAIATRFRSSHRVVEKIPAWVDVEPGGGSVGKALPATMRISPSLRAHSDAH